MQHVRRATFLAIILIGISATVTYAQRSVRDLERYMSTVRQSPYQQVPASIMEDANNVPLITALVRYSTDTADIVRSKALYIVKRVGQQSTNANVRERAVHALTLAIRDRNSGISGMAIEALGGFRLDNFAPADRDSIGRDIRPGMPHLDEILKLAGYLGLTNDQARMHAIVNSNLTFKYKWAARLALARIGDTEAIGYISNKLSRAVIDDSFVYDVVPDLVYTRQKTIFKFLESVVNSDRADCSSSDPDSNKKTICAYRVIEQMAPAIPAFPVKTDETGSLDTDDYASALTIVRTWFTQNPDYLISRDSF